MKKIALLKTLTIALLLMMCVGNAWGQVTVSYDFSDPGAVSGKDEASPGIALDSNIGFGSFKNSGTSDPAIYSGQLRLYQNATKGGSIKIYASNGVTITQVIVNASSATGDAAYTVDGGSAIDITGGSTYTITSIAAISEVEFYVKDGSTRIYVDDFEVTYTIPSTPTIVVSETELTGFTYDEGEGPSNEQSFTVEGGNLTSEISITAPTNYEISTGTGGSFVHTSPITLNESGGSVATTTIYVRLKAGLAIGTYNDEEIIATSTEATDKTITCSGSVTDPNVNVEDFANSNAPASYNTGSFVGNNGITWNYVASRDGNNDANGSGINLPALMLRRSSDNSAVYSNTIAGGIGNFSVKLYKGFTGGGNRQVELFINDISQGTSTAFDDYDEHVFEVNNINVAGDIVIRINNVTSSQVIVDDISWTGFAMPGLWKTDASTTDWSTGGNWDDGNVPTSITDVTIPSGATNNPIISAEATCNNLTIEGSLTIKSEAAGTGSLIVNGTSTGSINFERYLTGYAGNEDNGWHFLSLPISGLTIATSDFLPIEGTDDLYQFDQNQDEYVWLNYFGADFSETEFEVGKGYLVAYSASDIKTFAGSSIRTTDLTVGLDYTPDKPSSGWNLVGNPFTSAIDWDLVEKTASVNGAVYIISSLDGGFESWNGSVGDLTDGIIPANQGFFVHASAAAQSITMAAGSDGDQLHNTSTYYKNQTELAENTLKISVSSDIGSNNTYIQLRADASEEFDDAIDAYKLFGYGSVTEIYTHDETNLYSINCLPEVMHGKLIKLGVRATGEYAHYLSFEGIHNLSEDYQILLEDTKMNVTIELTEGLVYNFESDEGDNPNRFLLHFGAVGLDENAGQSSLRAYTHHNTLYVQNSLRDAAIRVIDLQGRLLLEQKLNGAGLHNLPLNFPAGVYMVQLLNSQEQKSVKVIVE